MRAHFTVGRGVQLKDVRCLARCAGSIAISWNSVRTDARLLVHARFIWDVRIFCRVLSMTGGGYKCTNSRLWVFCKMRVRARIRSRSKKSRRYGMAASRINFYAFACTASSCLSNRTRVVVIVVTAAKPEPLKLIIVPASGRNRCEVGSWRTAQASGFITSTAWIFSISVFAAGDGSFADISGIFAVCSIACSSLRNIARSIRPHEFTWTAAERVAVVRARKMLTHRTAMNISICIRAGRKFARATKNALAGDVS